MAILRRPLQCIACKTRIVTRTGIGHGQRQVHSFCCPACKVPITYVLRLNQKKVTWKFEPKPTNARWIRSEDGVSEEVTIYPELLAPRNFQFSPFLTIPFLMTDFGEFQTHEKVRAYWREKHWPVVHRLVTHYEQGNASLFDAEAKKLNKRSYADTRIGRLELLFKIHVACLRWFTFDYKGSWPRIRQRVSLSRAIEGSLVREFAEEYLGSGRLLELWRQINGIHDQFMEKFPSLSPALQIKYWKEQQVSLTDYVVPDKRFSELKDLYLGCFETLCRISVLAMAFEAIIHHRKLELPASKNPINMWQFEKLHNANKLEHVRKYPIYDLFVPFLDVELRNGIGHHAAYYDAAKDEVVSVKAKGSHLHYSRMSYTEFCVKVLELFSRLFYVEGYHANVLIEVSGRLR